MNKPPLIVVVGAGGAIGSVHFEALLLRKTVYPDSFRLGVCSGKDHVLRGNLTEVGKNNLGVNVRDSFPLESVMTYRDYSWVIQDPNVSGVVLATPTGTHANMAIEALRYGKHVLVEKPACADLAGVELLREAVNNSPNLVLGVGQVLGFFPAFWTIREFLRGNPATFTMRMWRTVPPSNDIANPAKAGDVVNPFFDLAIHDINLALQVFGQPNDVKVAEVRRCTNDSAYLWWMKVILEYTRGNVTVEAGINPDQDEPFSHGFCGCRGDALFRMAPTGVLIDDCPTPLTANAPWSDLNFTGAVVPFAAEHNEFLRAIGAGRLDENSPLSPVHALNAVELTLRMLSLANEK